MERVLGAEHPDTLTTRVNLARWTGDAGDAAGARDQLAALVPVMERVLGTEHLHTKGARDSLKSWTVRAALHLGVQGQALRRPWWKR